MPEYWNKLKTEREYMLGVWKQTDRRITRTERRENRLYLYSDALSFRLEPKTEGILRVTVTKRDSFSVNETPGIVLEEVLSDWSFTETGREIVLRTPKLSLVVNRETAAFTYLDNEGNVLLKEREHNAKELEEFTSYQLVQDGSLKKEIIETADGKKERIRAAEKREAGTLYHTRLNLCFQEKERLYGLGQQEEGFLNLRGKTVYVHQANRKIAIPMLVSTKGYGLLMNTYSPMIFREDAYGTYLSTQADREMDYFFIQGENPRGVIAGYRQLTGKACMLPRWAYGYIQSQERYETQEEILQVAREYKDRNLGLDGIVLDWMSWEDGQWGQKSFDPGRFPNPTEMIDKLHEMGVHFMISIWPNMDPCCANYKEFEEAGLLLPGSNVYNAFEQAGRELYWKQVEEKLFCHGVDAWWCDSSEPYTPEWSHLCRRDPAELYGEYCSQVANYIPEWETNAFALFHARALYEGQRDACERDGISKRVFNLTRSAYTGQQRYGTVLWSGDTSASWDTLRKQIAAGLSFCASGLPYWTADIGAFFVKTGEQWYWDGEYPEAEKDLGYQELFVRWYQWGCFLPLFRGHGTDCRRELWTFGKEDPAIYHALVETNHLRYRLLPYIYSLAGAVWREDASFMEMLAFAFPEDEEALEINDQYLFGESILVCPVTEAMYYEKNSVPKMDCPRTRRVYLPAGEDWYDFYTNRRFTGGQWVEADAELSKIPLFVKAGSVIPMQNMDENSSKCKNTVIYVYPGKDCRYLFYEDAGDGYAYEQGDYKLTEFRWSEENRSLTHEIIHTPRTEDFASNIAEIRVIC